MSELFNISNVADITKLTDLNDLLTLFPSRNCIRRPRYTENDLQSWYWHCSFAGGPNIIYSPCTGTVGRNNLPRLDLKVRSTPKYHYIHKHSVRMYTLFQNSVKGPFARFSRKSQYLVQKVQNFVRKVQFLDRKFQNLVHFLIQKVQKLVQKVQKICPKLPVIWSWMSQMSQFTYYRPIPSLSAHTDSFGTHRLIRHTSFHPFGSHRLIRHTSFHPFGTHRVIRHTPTYSAHTDLFGTHRLIRHTPTDSAHTNWDSIFRMVGVRHCTVLRVYISTAQFAYSRRIVLYGENSLLPQSQSTPKRNPVSLVLIYI